MQLCLSDGHHFFARFLTRAAHLPGLFSFIRIYPNPANKVIRITSSSTGEQKLYVFLEEWVKILDGQVRFTCLKTL